MTGIMIIPVLGPMRGTTGLHRPQALLTEIPIPRATEMWYQSFQGRPHSLGVIGTIDTSLRGLQIGQIDQKTGGRIRVVSGGEQTWAVSSSKPKPGVRTIQSADDIILNMIFRCEMRFSEMLSVFMTGVVRETLKMVGSAVYMGTPRLSLT